MGYFSNGCEGMDYEERYCSRCIHSDIGEGKEIGVDKPCPIWLAHYLFAYEECNSDSNAKTMLDMLIPPVTIETEHGPFPTNGECVMFVEVGS
jgi:hypothetical protein